MTRMRSAKSNFIMLLPLFLNKKMYVHFITLFSFV